VSHGRSWLLRTARGGGMANTPFIPLFVAISLDGCAMDTGVARAVAARAMAARADTSPMTKFACAAEMPQGQSRPEQASAWPRSAARPSQGTWRQPAARTMAHRVRSCDCDRQRLSRRLRSGWQNQRFEDNPEPTSFPLGALRFFKQSAGTIARSYEQHPARAPRWPKRQRLHTL
jgi:hypothetical protein